MTRASRLIMCFLGFVATAALAVAAAGPPLATFA
jgi:hypothetical protein